MSSEVLVSAQHTRHPQERLGAEIGLVVCLLSLQLSALSPVAALAAGVTGGTVRGRITFTGPEPGNRVIRMGMDPMCATANRGKQVVNDIYEVGDKNALGNVFVKLAGAFPATPV